MKEWSFFRDYCGFQNSWDEYQIMSHNGKPALKEVMTNIIERSL
jgi:hypothetical protein